MKLFNQFNPSKIPKAFNYAGNRMEEITRNLDRETIYLKTIGRGNAENIQLISIVQSIATENFNPKG